MCAVHSSMYSVGSLTAKVEPDYPHGLVPTQTNWPYFGNTTLPFLYLVLVHLHSLCIIWPPKMYNPQKAVENGRYVQFIAPYPL